MAYTEDYESKHLKRGKFGPLDIYPQEEKQKEDELSADFVKSGFKYLIPELLREHEYQGIAKDQPLINNSNFDNDVVRLLLQIVNKKEETSITSQNEANKKQQGPPRPAQTFRPSLILITGNQKTKEAAYAWFKQLANNESLAKLAKKIPVFNKRADNLPEILITLYEYQVPITRAVWYLKIMVLAYSTNLNDAAKKKRQPNIDVSSEWSLPLIKFLREIFQRLQNIEQSNNQSTAMPSNNTIISSGSLESFMNVDNLSSILLPVITHSYLTEQKLKCLWNFTTKLMRAMLDQNLLDKQFILDSLIDLLEKSATGPQVPQHNSQLASKSSSSSLILSQQNTINIINCNNNSIIEYTSSIKLILTTILQNMNHFLQSELLARRLAYFSCKRIGLIFNEYSNCFFETALTQLKAANTSTNNNNNNSQQSPDLSTKLKPFVTNTNNNNDESNEIVNHLVRKTVSVNSIKTLFDKIIQQNPTYSDQIILLTSIVHAIELGSMQSLIWNDVGDAKGLDSPYNGSPLDFLPCPPSSLIYTYDFYGCNQQTKDYVRSELEKAELCIKRRSMAVENKWSSNKLKLASIGIMQTKILALLDILDKNCYELNDINDNTIDSLYNKIFPKINLNSDDKDNQKNESKNNELNEEQIEINRPLTDREIIYLLCDWATTTKRCGLHRIYYIVFLIKKRQIDLTNQFKIYNEEIKNKIKSKLTSKKNIKFEQKEEESLILSLDITNNKKRKLNESDETSTTLPKKIKLDNNSETLDIKIGHELPKLENYSSQNNYNKQKLKKLKLQKIKENLEMKSQEFIFQQVLFDYLEFKAQRLEETSYESKFQFANLITLYYMFINCRLFSHDQFVTKLISRGETFRNNLNDIKKPFKLMKSQQNQKQLQFKQQQNLNNSSNFNHPPASMPPATTQLQHQKSLTNVSVSSMNDLSYINPKSVPTPRPNDYNKMNKSKHTLINNKQNIIRNSQNNNNNKPMSKLAQFVFHFPLPQSQNYAHERNQRFVVLYGFGSKKQDQLDKISILTKNFKLLFSRKSSIDLNNDTTIQSLTSSRHQQQTSTLIRKHYNTITTTNITLTQSELDKLNELNLQYSKLNYYDQYMLIDKIILFLIDIYKTLNEKNYLPKLQFIQFIFDLMESNLNIFNLLIFTIRLLQVGPLIEQYLKQKFLQTTNNASNNSSNANLNLNNSNNNNKIVYFEYLSCYYLNIIGVLRLHLFSLILWKDLSTQVFKHLFRLIRNVERPSKCSSHEKCAFMLLNEMYSSCSYLKQQYPQFEPIANKIKIEKCFTQPPSLDKIPNSNMISFQMKSDELLTSMITTTDHTIDEIENYINSKSLYYNFVAHVFVSISNLSKDEMMRVANLCAELTSRCSILITFWHNASKVLHQRNTAEPSNKERAMFSELLNKINITIPKCKENFKLFLSILASRHCLILNELIIMVVKTCVMACPGITSDQSHNYTILEPSASLACHIIQYLFTSSPKPLIYRRSSLDQRMITASLRSICFNSFLLVLKCLFLLSEPNNRINTNLNNNNSVVELDQFSSQVLLEICEHDWIKERCFNEGDNLLKQNQLLEPALGRRAQNLLHIICYPQQSMHMRKQSEQSSTKDFIKNILQNLDLWTLRESLLEFKLMFELEKQKDRYYEYFVECLAKTIVDYLIDPEKSLQQQQQQTNLNNNNQSKVHRSNSINYVGSNSNLNENSTQVESDNNNTHTNIDDLKSPNGEIESNIQNHSTIEDTNNENNNEFNETEMNDDSLIDQFQQSDDPEEIDPLCLEDFENLKDQRLSTQPIGIWLIAPLITKLPDACQIKVLDHSSKILQEISKGFWNAKTKTEKEAQAIKNMNAWHQQPFFTLLISCLRSKEEGPRYLLTALFNGLTDFISHGKEDKILSEDPRIKQIMMDTLHIRLSLVGSMFDFILRNSNDFANWAWLFVQLIYSGVVDPDTDQMLFTMIVDMLLVLIHHIITLEPNLDANKHYQTIIKKISKETKDLNDLPNTKAINAIRRLMPLNRSSCLDVLTVDPYTTTVSKTYANLHDKRRGFKFAKKEKISTWELIEGVKNASSLCFSWYGSAKLEKRMLKYEFQQKLLIRHKHMNIHKELTYLKEKPEIQNEDLIELESELITPVLKLPPPPPPPSQPIISQSEQKTTNSTIQNQKQQPSMIIPIINNSAAQSPGIHNTSSLNTSSDDVVLIGSTMGTHQPPILPTQQPNSILQHQHQPTATHSQIINRLQQHVSQHPTTQFNNNNEIDPTKQNSLISTPEKQRVQSGQTKKRTPRAKKEQQSRSATASVTNNVPQVQPPNLLSSAGIPPNHNQIKPNNMQQPIQNQMMNLQQQKLQPQLGNQATALPPRSTNSPMLPQQPPSQYQANNMYANRPIGNTNPQASTQLQSNMIPPQQQQQRMPNPPGQAPFVNQNPQYQPSNTQQQYIQQTQQAPQPQQVNNTMRSNMIQQGTIPQNRPTFPNTANVPTQQVAPQQQRKPPNQNQLPMQQQPLQQQQQPVAPQQKSIYPNNSNNMIGQPQPPIYSSNSQTANLKTNQQTGQNINNLPPTVQRTTTPDPNNMMGQQQMKYQQQQQQQAPQQLLNRQTMIQQPQPIGGQQQRTQGQNFSNSLNQIQPQQQQSVVNQQNVAWQQRQQAAALQRQQQQQQYQPQQQHQSQQHQFMQKQMQPQTNQMISNAPGMVQQQQQQRNLMPQQQPPTQQYQNY